MSRNPQLPIDTILPQALGLLRDHASLVIEASPGAGKTTRVPAALLQSVAGEVLVLEPRRIAARMAARRVAYELGEPVGETVGFQVRFEEVSGPRTRLRFVTEGVLTRRLVRDPDLHGVDAVVLDEFHERHLESDLALALLKRLQQRRPELRIVVMSATLHAAPIAVYLDNCPVLKSEGRAFPLTVRYAPALSEALDVQVRKAAESVLREGAVGDILVFLPGSAEIRRCMRECQALALSYDLLVLPLHGSLSPAEQDLVLAPSQKRKLILSTNVAESSVTLDGVAIVLDSGLARVAGTSPWTGLPTLQIARISQASAQQRAGRAGRTGPGLVVRLYAQEDFSRRAAFDTPEILRSDLSQLCLTLRAMGVEDSNQIVWLDRPAEQAVQSAESLLDRLGAVGSMVAEMVKYPLAPRLARILVESVARGVGEEGCVVTAALASESQAPFLDVLDWLDAPKDPRLLKHIEQLRRIARLPKPYPSRQTLMDTDALLQALLIGFPDRVARRKGNRALISNGASAVFAREAPVYEFFLAVDAEDRKENPLPTIRQCARIEPEWLIDLFPEHLREVHAVQWSDSYERAESIESLLYDELTLQETKDHQSHALEASRLLVAKAMESGLERFVDPAEMEAFFARLEFAGLERPDLQSSLTTLCAGMRSFAELRQAGKQLLSLWKHSIQQVNLDTDAPESLRLKGGRQVRVHYESGKPPWIASRLQDFFGMAATPLLGARRVPVVVHLLAPNQRAVQMTSDLAGFWQRLYPQVRKELMRRYPRHAWPENPHQPSL